MRNDPELVLGRGCPNDGVGAAIATRIRDLAATAREALEPTSGFAGPRRVAGLERLAEHVESLDRWTDQRLRALWLVSCQNGGDTHWAPGPLQLELLGKLGVAQEPPDADGVLSELTAAAAEDLIEGMAEGRRAALGDRDRALATVAELLPYRDRARDAEAEADALREALTRAKDEVGALTSQRDLLRSAVAAKQETSPKAKARRKRVAGHPHIYWRQNGTGAKTFEISYSDETGRQRWKTTGTDLEEAIATRDELRAEVKT